MLVFSATLFVSDESENVILITMRIFLTGLFIFVFFAIPARWYYVCEIRHNCGDEPTEQLIPRATSLVLMDGDSVILEGYEEFAFDSNSVTPITTENNEDFLAAVADYLEDNPEKNITIAGRFTEGEKGKSSGINENLGVARARAIEDLLEKAGIEESRMLIDHEMVDGNDLIKEPITFSLYTPEEKPDDYAKLQFRFEDMTYSDANFEFGKADFTPGLACLSYLDSLQIVLTDNDDIILSIIGHTDSVGDDKMNYKLGLDRADNAARYIVENYDVDSSIRTESVGETEPVAPNTNPDGTDNEAGRQKNRRVNFKLIKKDIEQ